MLYFVYLVAFLSFNVQTEQTFTLCEIFFNMTMPLLNLDALGHNNHQSVLHVAVGEDGAIQREGRLNALVTYCLLVQYAVIYHALFAHSEVSFIYLSYIYTCYF